MFFFRCSRIFNVHHDTKGIEDEAGKHRNDIKSAFKQLHQSLDERESTLLSKLNELVEEKKRSLLEIRNTLNAKKADSQRKLNECELKVMKSTKIHEIDSRIEEIRGISQQIQRVEVPTKKHNSIRNTKINVILKPESMMNAINGFGTVSRGVVPVLLSLTDNKNASISVQWKLNGAISESADENSKLKIEWTEVKSNDLAQFEEKWEHQKEVNVIGIADETTTIVSVESKVAIYVMRIQYFDGTNWSFPSEMKTASVEPLMDSWDPQRKGPNLAISGTSIMHYSSGYQSAYCRNAVSEGIHSWTFKIETITRGWFLLGVYESRCDVILQNSFQHNPTGSYCLELTSGQLPSLSKSGCWITDSNKRNYGPKCKNGDVIRMTLDLVFCTLSYGVNGRYYGKAWDVEKSSYRAACTMRGNADGINLLSYESNV